MQGGVQLFVEVRDRDWAPNSQLIDDIYIEEVLNPGHSEHRRSYGGSYHRASISLTFKLTCVDLSGGPNCTSRNLCQPLTNPLNGHVQQPAVIVDGSVAVYICDSGYALNGVSTRTCQSGVWTNSVPTCTQCEFRL